MAHELWSTLREQFRCCFHVSAVWAVWYCWGGFFPLPGLCGLAKLPLGWNCGIFLCNASPIKFLGRDDLLQNHLTLEIKRHLLVVIPFSYDRGLLTGESGTKFSSELIWQEKDKSTCYCKTVLLEGKWCCFHKVARERYWFLQQECSGIRFTSLIVYW